jgi:hypothetical protein
MRPPTLPSPLHCSCIFRPQSGDVIISCLVISSDAFKLCVNHRHLFGAIGLGNLRTTPWKASVEGQIFVAYISRNQPQPFQNTIA